MEAPEFEGKTSLIIRFEKPKNSQNKRIIWAENYLW
jgi:hypothetical protein